MIANDKSSASDKARARRASAGLTRTEVEAILAQGAYFRLGEYALRAELRDNLLSAFLDGIGKLAGEACRQRVSTDGLAQLHRHFPIAKIHLLEAHLMNTLRDELYYWSYRVGTETLGLSDPFYVDHLIVFRIHYPFLLARSAGRIERPPVRWRERMRLVYASLRDWRSLRSHLALRREPGSSATGIGASRYDPDAYHGDIPVPLRSHGPHIDTWYGHSYDGINLWLSIDGVNPDNTVILYPEMFGRPVTFDPVSMYLAAGIELSKPHKVDMRPGELLVFNPEMLHGTQVNISQETRVALTTRINPAQPRFGSDAPFHMQHWYCSEDLRDRKFSTVKFFPARRHRGRPSVQERAPYRGNRTIRLRMDGPIGDTPFAVCSADRVKQGEKLALDIETTKLLLWRDGSELRAFSRRCPHIGVDLADGYHDEKQVYCPGHGIAYSLSDGRSKCASFKLRSYEVFEKAGTIYVRLATSERAAAGRVQT